MNKHGQTPLHLAFQLKFHSEDDAEILIASATHLLLQRGANVNAQDEDHTTPLLLAIRRKMYDIMRFLLARGAKPNVKNVGGKTPLHLLLEGGNFSDEDDIPGLVRQLLESGADVNAQDQNHASPLFLAAERHLVDIARILLQHGAVPNIKNIKGKTPLHLLLEDDLHDHDDFNGVQLVVLLLDSGADVNAKDEDNTTPLNLAFHKRSFAIAQIILHSANAEVYWHDRTQWHITSEGGYNSNEHRPGVSPFSLERALDVNVQNMDLMTRLHWACYFGRIDMARELC
jgi:ankyrin repeat protein